MIKPNFRNLWNRLHHIYTKYDEKRKVSVLENFANNKAYICKKLGVIGDADVNRLTNNLRESQNKKRES